MIPDINIQISDEAVARMQAGFRDRAGLAQAIAKAMDKQNKLTVAHIQKTRLSQRGPETLGVRTNRLRSSVRRNDAVAQVTADSIVINSSIGSNVKYAAVHEFGFDGVVTVGAHKRKKKSLETLFGKRRKVRKADISVGSHSRKMNVAERAPFRRGIHDREVEYGKAISAVIVNFLDTQINL